MCTYVGTVNQLAFFGEAIPPNFSWCFRKRKKYYFCFFLILFVAMSALARGKSILNKQVVIGNQLLKPAAHGKALPKRLVII